MGTSTGPRIATSYVGQSGDIVKDGLIMRIDAANPLSYPGTGTTINDTVKRYEKASKDYTISLIGGVGFNSDAGGTLTLDGTSGFLSAGVTLSNRIDLGKNATINLWFKQIGTALKKCLFNISNLTLNLESFQLANGDASWSTQNAGGFWVLSTLTVPGNATALISPGDPVTATYYDQFSNNYTITFPVLSTSYSIVSNTTLISPDWIEYGFQPTVGTVNILVFNQNAYVSLSIRVTDGVTKSNFVNIPNERQTGWNMASITFKDKELKIYLNGETLATTNLDALTTFGNLSIGYDYFGTSYFNGRISNLTIYKRQLSDVEVAQNYEALKTRHGII